MYSRIVFLLISLIFILTSCSNVQIQNDVIENDGFDLDGCIEPIIVENVETGEVHWDYSDSIPEDYTEKENTEVNREPSLDEFEYEPLSMFQVVSSDDALIITEGRLLPFPDYNKDGRNAYLTPSGMLVYMDEWIYDHLPEGMNDFTVDMDAGEGGNIGVQAIDSRYNGEYLIKIDSSVIELDGIKCSVYVDMNEEGKIICYGIPNEGHVVYSYGFYVNSDEYEDHTLKISISNSQGDVYIYNGSVNEIVNVGCKVRYMGINPTKPEQNVIAEICNSDGIVVYSEQFKVVECRELNRVYLQMISIE